jgi:hypothetical protein
MDSKRAKSGPKKDERGGKIWFSNHSLDPWTAANVTSQQQQQQRVHNNVSAMAAML